MGGVFSSKKKYENMRDTNTLGQASECPMCAEPFSKKLTYNQINQHIDKCMQDPEAAEQQKRLRHMENEFANTQLDNSMTLVRTDSGGQRIERGPQVELHRFQEILSMEQDQLRSLATMEKVVYLKAMIEKMTPPVSQGINVVSVRRESILQDSLIQFNKLSNLRKVLNITFEQEVSQDRGGLSRDFFQQVFKEVFSSGLGIFATAGTDTFTYQVNESSNQIVGNQDLFYFTGQLLGKALFDHIPVCVSLNHSIIKALLGQTTDQEWSQHLEDFKLVDNEVYNSLKFILDSDLEAYQDLIEQYFTAPVGKKGQETELKFNGSHIRVTNFNKHEFVDLKCEWLAYKQVQEQLEYLKKGFNKIIEHEWISFMTADELEAQLCGQVKIDLDNWKNNTEYRDFMMSGKLSWTIRWFWQVMETYSQQQLARILMFCTGSSRLPLGGFADLESQSGQKSKFTIQAIAYKSGEAMHNLPRAHTCFNRLDLPKYPSYNHCKTAIDFVANNEIIGFGLEE